MKLRNLRERRLAAGMSQAQLADHAGVHEFSVYRAEAGHDVRPSTAKAYADALGTTIHDLAGTEELAGKAGAAEESRQQSKQVSDEDLEHWLREHGGKVALLSDEEIVENLEAIVEARAVTEDLTDLFEERAREVFEEEEQIEHALLREFTRGGDLLPLGLKTADSPWARPRYYTRLRGELRRRYGRYLAALDNYSYSAFASGEASDFITTSERRMKARQAAAEAIREAEGAGV